MQNISASPIASSDATYSRQRIPQDFLLIWMDPSIDQTNDTCQNTLAQLRNIVNNVNIFTIRDECLDFLIDVKNMKAIMIIESSLSQKILPLIHDITQLDSIYIVCRNKSKHEEWTKEWMKVRSVNTEIAPICESLRQAMKQHNRDSIAVSFIPLDEGASDQNLNQWEPSFMYTLKYSRKFFSNGS